MTIAAFVARRRRSLLTLMSILVAAGVVATFIMPVGLFPDVAFPRIAVSIDAGDRPPDQMEAVVTKPVEQAIRAIPGVKDLRTTSSRGAAELSINFAWGFNMDLALQRVQAAVAGTQQRLPQGVGFDVRRMDPTVFPVAAFSLTSATATPVEIRRFADRVLSPVLSTIDGVARVHAQGGALGEYRVETDLAKLMANGLAIDDVATAITNANVLTASGRVEDHGKLLLILTQSRLADPRQIGAVVIKTKAGGLVRVADVATVTTAPAPQWVRVTADGRDAVLVQVYQQPGGNTVQISKDVRQAFSKAMSQGPAGVLVKAWYDQSDLISESATALRNAILIGVVLAALVLLVFLRDWKVTLAAVVSVPATLAATTLILKLTGQSFNIMTLGGMAAAIGLIIDDAIVMIEHIERRLAEQPGQGRPALDRAVAEFLRPLFGSSAATIVIFAPLAFLTGVTGAFFKALSITMAVALTLSFLVAWWLTPVLVRSLAARGVQATALNPQGRILSRYRSGLEGVVARPLIAVGGMAALAAVGLICFFSVGSGFIPKIDEGGFILDYVAPPGMSLTETNRLMGKVEDIIRATPDVDTYSRRTGLQLGGGLTEPNQGDYFIRLKAKGRRDIEAVMDEVRGKVQANVPGLNIETAQLMEDLIGDLTAVPQPIEIKLYSDSADLLNKAAPAVADAIGKVRGIAEVKDGVVIAGDGLQIRVDPARAEQEGIDPAEASKQLESLLSGAVATQVQSGANLADVRVWTPAAARARASQVQDLMLKSPDDGHLFPVGRIATVEMITGQAEINHENLRRMTAVTARVTGRDTGSAAKEVERVVRQPGLLPAGVTFEMGGLFAEQQQAFRGMALVFTAAAAAVFTLLLFLYESFRIALTILVMPLIATSAVAIGLWLTGVDLNIMALMGMTMILGIVTEVAIFYFTEFETLVADGMDRSEALVQAGANRLRPIAMTTLAAILSLAPLALALGGGASMERPLAVAIIAGLIVQGPLVLMAMPALYRLIGGTKVQANIPA